MPSISDNIGPTNGATERIQQAPETDSHVPADTISDDPTTTVSNESIDLWAQAYTLLEEREPDLVKDYEKHIQSQEEEALSTQRAALSNPESVKETLQNLQEERKTKQWKFTIRSKDHKIKDQLEKLVKFVSLADGIIKQAVSAQPYAALAWSAVSIFLPLISGSLKKDTEMVKGFITITDLQFYWKNCEDAYLTSSSTHYEKLVEPLSNLYSFMLEYQMRAICHLSKKQLTRAWEKVSGQDSWTTNETELVEMSNRCKEHIIPLQRSEVQERFNLEMEKLDRIGDIGANIVDTIKIAQQSKDENDFFQDLKLAAGSYLEGMKNNDDPVAGTCEWFYNDEKLHQWLNASTPGVFWITAGPGCGKTVLSRSLILNGHLEGVATIADAGSSIIMETKKTTICYFFFKEGDQRRSSISSAICALLHQLFIHDETNSLVKKWLPTYTRSGKILTESFNELWTMLVHSAQVHTGNGDIICVLDALDECNNGDRKKFVENLDRLYADTDLCASARIKFLITSRPYDDIERSLLPLSRRTIDYYRFDADERHHQISKDISLVIDSKIDILSKAFGGEGLQKIANTLKSQGTKTYLWLQLTFGIINDDPSLYSRSGDVEALLSKIPSEVSDAYEKILSKSKDSPKTTFLLQIILAATRSLTLDEANYALTLAEANGSIKSHAELERRCWQRDFKTVVKNLCGHIVSVYDGKLSFIHLTAREFLTTKAEPISGALDKQWGGYFAESTVLHETLAGCCMQYLLLSDFQSKTPLLFEYELEVYKFLNYASENWPVHFKIMDEQTSATYLPQASQLCNTALAPAKTWGKVYLEGGKNQRLIDKSIHHWSSLAVAAFVGIKRVVQELIQDGTDVNERCGGYGSALNSAVAADEEEIASLLISEGAYISQIGLSRGVDATALDISVLVRQNVGVTRLLLRHGASPIAGYDGADNWRHFFILELGKDHFISGPCTTLACAALLSEKKLFYILLASFADISTTETIISTAKEQTIIECGKECVALVLNLLDDYNFGKILTEDVLNTLFSVPLVGERVLAFLVQQNRQHLLLRRSILGQTASLKGINGILQNLLDTSEEYRNDITQDILEVTAYRHHPATLRLFIRYSRGNFDIKALLHPAVANHHHCFEMPSIVFEFGASDIAADESCQIKILNTQSRYIDGRYRYTRAKIYALLLFSSYTDRVKKLLLQKSLDLFEIYPPVEENYSQIVRDVLAHVGSADIIDTSLLEYAAAHCSAEAIQLLLECASNICTTSDILLMAAASNNNYGREVMAFLLRWYQSDAIITPAIAERAATSTDDILPFLLEVRPHQVAITVELVQNIKNKKTLESIVKLRPKQVSQIATRVLNEMINSKLSISCDIENLLNCCPGSWFHITEALIFDLLVNFRFDVTDQLALLLHKAGDQVVISDKIVAAAITHHWREWIFEFLKKWQPNACTITPWVVQKVAAGAGREGLEYLMKCAGETLTIDDKLWNLAKFRDIVRSNDFPLTALQMAWGKGPVTDERDVYGRTALHSAVRKRIAYVQFVLDVADPDIHATDPKGRTALHIAIYNDTLTAVLVLLAHGANPHTADFNRQTPISIVETIEDERKFELDTYTVLLALKDEWFAQFWALGVDVESEDLPDGKSDNPRYMGYSRSMLYEKRMEAERLMQDLNKVGIERWYK